QFSNPDSIKNAVKRYNMQRAAEREECRKDKEPHKMSKMRFCKMRSNGNDVLGMVTSRDLDVETQMSLDLKSSSSSSSHNSINDCVSNCSMDNVQRLAGGAESTRSKKQHKPKRRGGKRGKVELEDAYGAHIAGLHRELCAELEEIAPSTMRINVPRKPMPKARRASNNRKKSPQAKLQPEQQEKIMQRLKQVLSVKQQPTMEQQAQPAASQWTDIIPSPQLNAMNAHLCRALDTTPSLACLFMQEHGLASMEPQQQSPPPPPPFVEDSDLEQEYADRPDYMRYIERLPYASHNNHNNNNDNDGAQKAPCFVELEGLPHWIRLQRSLTPMRYTSQRSDTDTLTLCDQPPPPPTKVPVKKAKPALGKRRAAGGRDKAPVEPISLLPSNAQMAVEEQQQQQQQQQQKRRRMRQVICTRSLENLKYQKMAIYNRISLMQERIITALDRLQGRLLQLQMPTCSNQEKQRRERNAFQFCVRFARNSLYPVRGLIEEVRSTPAASFHSATSNEASQRVVSVYTLMLHSVQSYKRQLRFFLLDKVPQKLSALIEMMYTLTNVCVDKGVLDRHDPVVECLQQRCTSFITFIEDMQQERFQLARETYRRLQKSPARGGGMRDRYDLKMFLNDLKLYEPRLVPKQRAERRRPRRPRPDNANNAQAVNSPTPGHDANAGDQALAGGAQLQLDPADEVATHIECVHCGDYRDPTSDEGFDRSSSDQKDQLSSILALLQQPPHEQHELHRQLLKAMEHVTKSQVRQVLDPLVRSLGAMLDKK
ncbi:hypothetical protein KR044_010938, partial [Drosophila immigrans]